MKAIDFEQGRNEISSRLLSLSLHKTEVGGSRCLIKELNLSSSPNTVLFKIESFLALFFHGKSSLSRKRWNGKVLLSQVSHIWAFESIYMQNFISILYSVVERTSSFWHIGVSLERNWKQSRLNRSPHMETIRLWEWSQVRGVIWAQAPVSLPA